MNEVVQPNNGTIRLHGTCDGSVGQEGPGDALCD